MRLTVVTVPANSFERFALIGCLIARCALSHVV